MICGECAMVADTAATVDMSDEKERRWIEGCHRHLCLGPGCTCQHRPPGSAEAGAARTSVSLPNVSNGVREENTDG